MTGNENEVALALACRREFKIILHLDGLAVFISAKQADVEVIARVFKVIRVAAIESNLLFRREYDPHVGIALVTVELIRATFPKRDHIRKQAGAVERFLFNFGN